MSYLTSTQIEAVFKSQKDFFKTGKTKSVEFRKESLNKLKSTLIDHKELIYQALKNDLGKTPDVIDMAELGVILHDIDFALEHLDEWVKPEAVPTADFLEPSKSVIEHEAYGVCYIIGPFNYPFNLTLTPLVGAIVGGNTCILKPAENVPESSKVMKKIINEVFPEEYISVIEGGKDENTLLLTLPFDFIFFTGSANVGKVVMQAASQHLTPIALELGGKSPLIALKDADQDKLVKDIVFGKYLNSGQTCIAPDYLYIDESIKDEFLVKLISAIKEQYSDLGSTGKIVSSQQVEKIEKLVSDSQGKVLIGGNGDQEQRFYAATVVDNVQWNDPLMQAELFAPVLPVLTFISVDEVISHINTHAPKPLVSYIYTQNTELAKPLIDKIQAGACSMNDVMMYAFSPYLPFGGVGSSGIGKYHGYYSYLAFTHPKAINIH